MTAPAVPLPTLSVQLPGVVSWARPREQPLRGGGRRTAYPETYVQGRASWSLAVAVAVSRQDWKLSRTVRYAVRVRVCGPGRLDLDRVVTAVADALQNGRAISDDCRIDAYDARRVPYLPGEPPHTTVEVTPV